MQSIRPIMTPELRLALMQAPELRPLDQMASHVRHSEYMHRITAARTNPIVVPTSTIPGQAPFRYEVDVLGPGIIDVQPGETCDRHAFPSANGRCYGRCIDAVRPGCCAACLVICGAMAAIAVPRALEAA